MKEIIDTNEIEFEDDYINEFLKAIEQEDSEFMQELKRESLIEMISSR